jgi:hypothetical protein
MATLTEQFDRSGSEPIIHEGKELYSSYWLPINEGATLQISISSFVREPVQGLRIVARARRGQPDDSRCKVQLAGHIGTDFVLWTDTAPAHSELTIVAAPPGSQLGIWNVWRHPQHETMLYGLNNAAIEVVQEEQGKLRLRCSDGVGEPDFDDLVVELVKPELAGAKRT